MTKLPKRPAELTCEHSRKLWDKHAKNLWDEGVLTTKDVESFIVLCQVYGRLQQLASLPFDPNNFRAATQYTNALKMHKEYATRFGLIGPKNRATAPTQEESLQDIIAKGMTS